MALHSLVYNLNFLTEPNMWNLATTPPLQLNFLLVFFRALVQGFRSWDLCFSQLILHPLSNIIHGFEVSFHQYADDTSLFSILSSDSMSDELRNLRMCTDAINDWHLVNFLQLNPQKSEIMFIGTPVRLKTPSPPPSINFSGILLPSSTTLKLLGVTFDSHLSFKEHSASNKSCNYLIWSIWQIRPLLSVDTTSALAVSFSLAWINAIPFSMVHLPS